jgi:hypothetical protein
MVAQTDLETLYAQSRNRPEACSPVEAAPRQHPDLPTIDPRRCPTAAELDFTQPLRALRRFVDEGALPGRRFNVRLGSNSDLGERRAGVRFYLKSGPDLAQPIRLISADSVVA